MRYLGTATVAENGARQPTGRWRFWYPNGQLQLEGAFDGGSLPTTDGLKPARTDVSEGGRDGAWSAWTVNGAPIWYGAYENGLREGAWTWWFEGGQEQERGSYSAGLENGLHMSHHRNGRVAAQGAWVLGNRVDAHRTWDETGLLREEMSYDGDGLRAGMHRVWSFEGILVEEAFFHADEWTGLRTLWDNEGRVTMIGHYVGGVLDGDQSLYHPNGKLRQQGLFDEGQREGVHVGWDSTGAKTWEIEYVGGVPGKHTSFFSNGFKHAETELDAGMPNGSQRMWSDTGQLMAEGRFDAGERTDAWRYWRSAESEDGEDDD
ncbi:MAG: hypothetical protein GY711_08300 [bacterium]|nr:hypothetical protein [bacterium]